MAGPRADATDLRLAELDRQVERGSRFTHAALEKGFNRLAQAEVLLAELVAALDARGVVPAGELGVSLVDEERPPKPEPPPVPPPETSANPEQGRRSQRISWPSIAVRVDDPNETDEAPPAVDCAARLPVCQAVCCRLKFALSEDEITSGKVRWDIGHPYIIRHDSDGACTHHESGSGACGIYADRPRVCRRYDCSGDARIWADFEQMELNQDWIDRHLPGGGAEAPGRAPRMEAPSGGAP